MSDDATKPKPSARIFPSRCPYCNADRRSSAYIPTLGHQVEYWCGRRLNDNGGTVQRDWTVCTIQGGPPRFTAGQPTIANTASTDGGEMTVTTIIEVEGVLGELRRFQEWEKAKHIMHGIDQAVANGVEWTTATRVMHKIAREIEREEDKRFNELMFGTRATT